MRRALIGLVLVLAGAVALQAQCTVSKSSIDFGNVNVGANSPQILTVSVAAGFPGTVNFSFQAVPTVFSVSPQSLIGVAAGQSRDVTVSFTPNGAGAAQGEVLVNTSSQFNCPVSPTNAVILTGTGVAAGAPFTISPNPLNFGNVVAGATRTLPITVAIPSGQNPLDFSFQITGAGFSTSDPLAFSLTAGLSQTINITFTAGANGAFTGALQGTAGSTPVFVSLQANVVPAFTLSPTSLALGDVLLGCSASQGAQVIPNATLSFSLASDTSFFTVAPTAFVTGVTQAVQVRFTPSSVGSTKGTISVAATLNNNPVLGSSLSLTGRGFDVVPNTAAADFGSVPVGGASPPQTVTLATAPVTAATLLFSATSDNPAFTVTMNGGQAQITFRPSAVKAESGTITFTITRTDQGFTPCVVTRAVSVRGAGVSLGLALNPTSVDFGPVTLGTTSPNKNVSLNSTATLGFTGTVTSDNPAFLVTPASFSLSAGGAQAFTLNFRPPATGAASGTLTFSLTSTSVSAAAFQTSLTLQVTGTGQAPVTLTVTPTALDFGDVTVGLAASRTVTVTNTGQAPGAVTATPSTPTVTVSPSTFNLNGGASQQVVIGFLPATSGTLQARVDFAAGDTTVSLGLAGRGVIPTFSYTFVAGQSNTPVSPGGSIGLPTTPVGSSNAVDFQIRNSGTVAGTVGRIVTSGGTFTLLTPPTLPATLAPGETLTVRVSFQPATPGTATGSLTVDNQSFTLSGLGRVRAVTFTGAGSTPPRTQQTIGFQLPDRPTTTLTGTLTLEFVPNALGGDDQMIAFPNGLRRIDFTVPANTDLSTFTGGVNQIGFQTGTVAGTITFRLTLQAGGVDVTPAPAPAQIFTVARAGPVIVGTPTIASRTATTFQVVVVGFATSREVNTATFRFNASGTGSLQTPALTLNANAAYIDFYSSIAADPNPARATNANLFGSQFTMTVPFNVTGDLAAIRSVTITLSNGDGTSAAVDVSF
jgi:hypothetical protein